MKFLKLIFSALKKPIFFISLLFYYIVLFGIKVGIPSTFGILNVFTLLFIPFVLILIYLIWYSFYNTNIDDDLFNDEIRKMYFKSISIKSQNEIENLFKLREEIQNISKTTIINNESKKSLINELKSLDLNELIKRYASISVKIKFIDDFLKKNKKEKFNNDTNIKRIVKTKEKYLGIIKEINNAFKKIQTQSVLFITDDISEDLYSKQNIDDILHKINRLEKTSSDINKFYTSVENENIE